MSMLTPPGMGGKYRVTGNKYPRMRRGRRRSRIVLAVIASVAAIGVIGWGSLQLIDVFSGDDKASTAGSGPDCAPEPSGSPAAAGSKPDTKLPEPRQITVNVLNATPRTGLAQETADELKKRGFKIGEVGNATEDYDKKVKGTGIVLGSKSALTTSLPVLATQFTEAEKRTDTRKSTEIDLIIGDGFKELASKRTAAKAMTALAHPAPTPTPSKHCQTR